MNFISVTLIIAPAVLRAWLIAILLRRDLHRQFRVFFLYNVFAVTAAVIKLAAMSIGYRTYFVVFWITEVPYVVLELLAMLEVFPITFKTFSLLKVFRRMLWAVVAATIGISLLQPILMPPQHANRLLAWIYSLEIGVRYLQGGIFLLFVALVKFWQIEWRQYTLGIVLGFGVLVVGTLTPGMLRSEFGTNFTSTFQYVPAVAYIVAVFIWLFTFYRPPALDPLETTRAPLNPGEVANMIKRFAASIKESWR
ncbi:MAG TPA: hypothetical protein VFP59_20395 [Candidatus Angelobacter sp.]|nr:hypothetical protein [Candidatus Angelobacter sp.]